MPGKDIIVIGASAGGIGAIPTIVAGLPADFAASVFVVVHTSPDAPGVLDVVFGTAGPLPAIVAAPAKKERGSAIAKPLSG